MTTDKPDAVALRQTPPRVLGPLLRLEDLPTKPPAVVAVRQGPTPVDNEIYWQYIGLDDPNFPHGPWWSDGTELGFGGTSTELVDYVNTESDEWVLFATPND